MSPEKFSGGGADNSSLRKKGVSSGLKDAWAEELAKLEEAENPPKPEPKKEAPKEPEPAKKVERRETPSKLVGRAEYENVRPEQLFEGKKPTELFPWILGDGFEKGMVVADRGTGKTFFIRKLTEELNARGIGVEVNHLDKVTLQYVGTKASRPKVIVYDDLHYLLEAKRLGELEGNPVITDQQILDILEAGVKRAQELGARILFVSTGGPADMYDRFSTPEDKMRFLKILEGCTATDSDRELFMKNYMKSAPVYAPEKFGSNMPNVLRFRDVLDQESLVRMRHKFGALDVPFLEAAKRGYKADHLVYEDQEFECVALGSEKGKQDMIRITSPNMAIEPMSTVKKPGVIFKRTIEQAEEKALRDTLREVAPEALLSFYDENGNPVVDMSKYQWTSTGGVQKTQQEGMKVLPVNTIRELSAVHQFLGAINRESLDINFGTPSDDMSYAIYNMRTQRYRLGNRFEKGGWFYSARQVTDIAQHIRDIYAAVAGKAGQSVNELAKKLLDLPEEISREDEEKFFIKHEMSKE